MKSDLPELGKRLGTTNEPIQKIYKWNDQDLCENQHPVEFGYRYESGLIDIWKDDTASR
ncbi:MAG: hypothetical protein U5K71_12785 [Gracilimonas sp.]|nr:hypothetical protein [Gracilimonas sp.]